MSNFVQLTKNDAPPPSFPKNWDERLKSYGPGMTVVYTAQCPYVPKTVAATVKAAKENGISARSFELTTTKAVRDSSPSAYGTFGIVYNGGLLSYYYLSTKDLLRLTLQSGSST